MKKFFSLLAVGCALLATTSCSSDEPAAPVNEGVSFNLCLPESLDSRAFGTGTSALNLKYAVYEENQTDLLTEGTGTFVNLKATISLKLPKGKKYDIVFWAQSDTQTISFTPATQTIAVNYSAQNRYSDDFDAFFHTEKGYVVTDNETKTVYLKRPFAQLNIGTDDMADATLFNLDYSTTEVTVSGVYESMNLVTGALSDEVTAQFPFNPLPATTEKFPYPADAETSPYKYLSMNYLLVDEAKSIHTVTLNVADTDYTSPTYDNVPLQRNYRTNIFGSLLTNPGVFEVIIAPSFIDPDYNEPR